MNGKTTRMNGAMVWVMLASVCVLATGCSALNEVLAELDGSGGGAQSAGQEVPDDLPEGERAFTPAEAEIAKDGWTMLTADQVRANGVCPALVASSPVKEYWEVESCKGGKSGLSWLRGAPKGTLSAFYDRCNEGLESCDIVGPAILGEAPEEYRKLFQGLLLMQDPKLIGALVSSPSYNIFWAGSFFGERGFAFFDGITGLGMVGEQADRKYLDALVDETWKAEELGRDLRNKVSRSIWWMGDAGGAPSLMAMLEPEHAKRYQNREFRPIALGALTAWKSKDAVEFCESNMRDLGDEDRAACMLYLVELGETGSLKDMIRYAEESGEVGPIALGRTGAADARAYLDKSVDQYAMHSLIVARALSGSKEGMKILDAQIADGSWMDYGELTSLAWFAGTKHASKYATKAKQLGAKLAKNGQEDYHALTVCARAQLGDASAIGELIELLDSPDESVRETVVDQIGGRWGMTVSPIAMHTIVADQKLLEALVVAMERESDSSQRARMANAALNIRAMIRATK